MIQFKILFFFTAVVPCALVIVRYLYLTATATISTLAMIGFIATLNVIGFKLLPQDAREYLVDTTFNSIDKAVDKVGDASYTKDNERKF